MRRTLPEFLKPMVVATTAALEGNLEELDMEATIEEGIVIIILLLRFRGDALTEADFSFGIASRLRLSGKTFTSVPV